MRVPRSNTVLLGLVLLVAACGGGDGPTDPGGNDGGGTTRTIKEDPSFTNDIFEIFQRRGCTGSSCHGGSGGQGGLVMTSASTARTNLVGVAAAGKSGEIRVIAGDADGSYLVKKLTGAEGIAGVRMPFGGAALDNTDLTNVKNWINQGAKNN